MAIKIEITFPTPATDLPITEEQLWEWVEQQSIITIENAYFENKQVVIIPMFESQLTPNIDNKLRNDYDAYFNC